MSSSKGPTGASLPPVGLHPPVASYDDEFGSGLKLGTESGFEVIYLVSKPVYREVLGSHDAPDLSGRLKVLVIRLLCRCVERFTHLLLKRSRGGLR